MLRAIRSTTMHPEDDVVGEETLFLLYPEAHGLQLFPASVSQICQPCADYALQLLPGRKKPLSKGAR